MTQPGTAGTDDDPLDAIVTAEVVVNGESIDTLVGLAFDNAAATDGVLRFDGTGSTSGITDGSAKVIIGGTTYDVAGGEWVDASGTSHTLDSWEKVINSQFDVTVTGTNGPVAPGESLDVTADLTNNGTDQDTQDVTLDIDNSVGEVARQSVTLSAGQTSTETLTWSVPSGRAEQDYQATVVSADDSAQTTVTVRSIAPSLVSHWTFDSADTNSGTAVDTVGSNDGTINGATTGVSGQINEAYSFDGTDDYVDIPNDILTLDGSQPYTLSAWLNVPSGVSINRRYDTVFNLAASSEVRVNSYSTYKSSGTTQFKIYDGNNEQICNGTDIRGQGWVQLTVTYDPSSGMELYENGVSQSTDGFTGTPQAASRQDRIGYGGDDPFEGRMDDVRMYDKALTSAEVSSLYNNGSI